MERQRTSIMMKCCEHHNFAWALKHENYKFCLTKKKLFWVCHIFRKILILLPDFTYKGFFLSGSWYFAPSPKTFRLSKISFLSYICFFWFISPTILLTFFTKPPVALCQYSLLKETLLRKWWKWLFLSLQFYNFAAGLSCHKELCRSCQKETPEKSRNLGYRFL